MRPDALLILCPAEGTGRYCSKFGRLMNIFYMFGLFVHGLFRRLETHQRRLDALQSKSFPIVF
jgi:hypothetical protein